MANKITQLVNESGDNLYPLAGGMAADSIDTEMLKDGAVTSDKIDWTTIDIVRPLSVTAQSNFTIYENGSGFIEFGGKNIVLINLEITVGSSSVSGETILAQFGNDLPIGSAGPQMSAIATSGSSIFPCTSWIRATTKALVVTPSSTVQANGKFRITGAYIA